MDQTLGHDFFSTVHLDYLQRNLVELGPPMDLGAAFAQNASKVLSRVTSIGRDRNQKEKVRESADQKDSRPTMPTLDALIGLGGHRLSLAFWVGSSGQSVAISLGSWNSTSQGSPALQNASKTEPTAILTTLLRSLYPAISFTDLPYQMRAAPRTGLVLGIPSAKRSDIEDSSPLDRLVRAMSGTRWSALTLAEPLHESQAVTLRNSLTNEIRRVMTQAQDRKEPSPLANQYAEWLTSMQKNYSIGLATGLWRTAVYLMGDSESYPRLASVWRAIYSGEQSQVQPVKSFELPFASALAASWALPSDPGAEGPGSFRHPYKYQTVLSSEQLALYAHFPKFETSGFKLRHIPTFGVVGQDIRPGTEKLTLGKVLSRENIVRDKSSAQDFNNLPETFYSIPLASVTKHVFVAGVTGAGKTKTIFHLLKNAFAAKIPFLVIEPAKTEYRELLHHPEISHALQIFTLGDEQVSPFRLNPFEVLQGTSISKHIDLLRSLFSSSFGLWTPLPQILEECLNLIYKDKGWDITTNENTRLVAYENDRSNGQAFPTLSDLLVKVDEVTSHLQWDAEATARIKGSLRDRLRNLRNGGKGRMLDVHTSVPVAQLFERPTILELEPMGDDDDKAFMMGLLLIRLAEYRRSPQNKAKANDTKILRHILVFEEAHRLLTNVPAKGDQGAADPRAKAVETFANLLSEIRSYGQGVVISDQVPVKLSPDVIKNTNLKISHRIVDLEDRKLLGGSMVMTEEQIDELARLLPGTAAVYSEGDNAPALVQVPPPPLPELTKPDDEEIRAHSRKSASKEFASLLLRHEDCTDTKDNAGEACDAARELVETATFQQDFTRLILSLIDDSTVVTRLWAPLEAYIGSAVSSTIQKDTMVSCVISRSSYWYAYQEGSRHQWSYAKTEELAKRIVAVLQNRDNQKQLPGVIEQFREIFFDLHLRKFLPYSKCEIICDDKNVCLYRSSVAQIKDLKSFPVKWYESNPFGASKLEAWQVGQLVAEQLVEWNEPQREAIRRIALCYCQMMLRASAEEVFAPTRDKAMEEIIKESLMPLDNL